jgi:LysR family transcriptional regulator, glycine cleavage system transcriptional activator
MSRLPLHPLQGFVLAARLGNLSRAAEALHLTVSALSHQIRALEERFGRRLFARGPRGIALTAEGERLFEAVDAPFTALERALRAHGPRRDEVLTLSLLSSFASSWLVPRLPPFLAAHPQIELNLQSSVALVDFDRDPDIDAAVRYGPGKWPKLHAVHLFDDWITPLASPALLARHGGAHSPDDLARLPLLDDRSNRWRDWFVRCGCVPPRKFVAAFDDAEALHRAAASGLGVAMGRLTLARPLIEAGLLVELSTQRLKSEFAHYLVYPPRSEAHAGLVAFRDWLVAQAKAYSAQPEVEMPRKRVAKKVGAKKTTASRKPR